MTEMAQTYAEIMKFVEEQKNGQNKNFQRIV